LPEGYEDINFFGYDFEIEDPAWIAEQDQLDKEHRTRKRVIFETIFKEWKKEFTKLEKRERIEITKRERQEKIERDKCVEKERIETMIKMFKSKEPLWRIANRYNISQHEAGELLIAAGVARWINPAAPPLPRPERPTPDHG
jgi:hypothetical protein